jgi:hypothetical protein
MTHAQRFGLWILIGVSAFEIVFPVLSAANSASKLVQFALLPMSLLALAGFRWPRVIALFVSAGLAIYFWQWSTGEGSILRQVSRPDDLRATQYIAMSGTVPAVGYSVCAGLLLLPWVTEWQRFIRPIAARERGTMPSPSQSTSDDNTPKEACIWCDQIVVRPSDEYCPSCNRPL